MHFACRDGLEPFGSRDRISLSHLDMECSQNSHVPKAWLAVYGVTGRQALNGSFWMLIRRGSSGEKS